MELPDMLFLITDFQTPEDKLICSHVSKATYNILKLGKNKINLAKYGAKLGSISILSEWKHQINFSLCARLARDGHLKALQWARANDHPWDGVCANASYKGHLELLQWARANGCPWDELTCMCIAECGHLKMLQWARANGCPWHKLTCLVAIRTQHWEIVQWARENGCPEYYDRN